MLKKIITTMLIISMLPINVFAASPQTKQMIHDTLSKYCIPPKKENCNPSQEGQYDPNYDFCLCNDDGMIYNKSERICKDCRAGTYYRRDMKDNKCKDCSPGTYSGSGAASCTNCPAGKYASGSGSASCSSCWKGSYQPNSGQSTCSGCPTNHTTSGTGSTSYNDCYCTCTYGCRSDNSCKECNSSGGCSGNYVCNNNGSCVCGLSESDCKCGKSNSGCSCISPETNCPCGSSDGCTCDAPDECDPNTEVRSGRCGCKPKPEPEPDPEPTPTPAPTPAPKPDKPIYDRECPEGTTPCGNGKCCGTGLGKVPRCPPGKTPNHLDGCDDDPKSKYEGGM